MPVVNLTATVTIGRILRGTVTDGAPTKIETFDDTNSVVVTHNRMRALQSVKVYVLASGFGSGKFNDDDFSISSEDLEELSSDHYTVVYSEGLDSFTVTMDNNYTGEIRFS